MLYLDYLLFLYIRFALELAILWWNDQNVTRYCFRFELSFFVCIADFSLRYDLGFVACRNKLIQVIVRKVFPALLGCRNSSKISRRIALSADRYMFFFVLLFYFILWYLSYLHVLRMVTLHIFLNNSSMICCSCKWPLYQVIFVPGLVLNINIDQILSQLSVTSPAGPNIGTVRFNAR